MSDTKPFKATHLKKLGTYKHDGSSITTNYYFDNTIDIINSHVLSPVSNDFVKRIVKAHIYGQIAFCEMAKIDFGYLAEPHCSRKKADLLHDYGVCIGQIADFTNHKDNLPPIVFKEILVFRKTTLDRLSNQITSKNHTPELLNELTSDLGKRLNEVIIAI